MPTTELLTSTEVAAIFRVDRATVTRWAREGRIPSVRHEGMRGFLFRRDDVDQLLESERAS